MKNTHIAGKTFLLELPCAPQVPIAAYAVTSDGVIAEKQPIDEKGHFAFTGQVLSKASLYIAPDQEGRSAPKVLADLEAMEAYRPVIKGGFRDQVISIRPIPDFLLENWFLCFCRVRGRVVREFCFSIPQFPWGTSRKICFTLPVCTARVHICRLKPIIFQLPDRDIFKIRDVLIDIPVLGPRVPVPPFPPIPPEPFAGIRSVSTAISAKTEAITPLSQALTYQLRTDSPTLLRRAFETHFDEIRPLIPHFDLCSLFYRKEEILVAELGEDGYFDEGFWHRCAADEDLYFWVEYLFDGQWVTVYKPSLCTGAYWNYVCGTSVTLKVTDSRVTGCRPLRGRFFEVTRVGSQAWIPLISPATGLVHGLSGSAFGDSPMGHNNADFERPFGKTLAVLADFGADLPDAATATHYRVSFKEVSLPDIDTNWTVLNTQIARTYVDNVQGADGITRPVWGSFTLNDAAHPGFYKIPMDDAADQTEIPVPAPPQLLFDRDWYDTAEFKIAEWDTSAITNGVYMLRIQLCREVGGVLQPTAVRSEIYQTPTPGNFLQGDLAPEDNLYRHNTGTGTAMGFQVKLSIDNRA